MFRRIVRWFLVIAVLAAAGYFIWYKTRPKPIDIVIKTVDRGIVERTVANTRSGTVKACRRARLSPSMGGQIAKLPIKEGDRVRKGDLLLELWNDDLKAELRLVQKEAKVARARVKAACLTADVAQREADRLRKLKDQGAISEEAIDKVATEAKALRADCEAAGASELMSGARIRSARARLAKTRLTAPFEGIIAEVNGELHEYLTPSPPGIPTPTFVDLIDYSCFYIEAPIDEVDAPEIKPDLMARITLDAFGDRHFPGRVRRISPYILDREKQARTVDVEIEFSRPEDIKELLAGYSADVEIVLEQKNDSLRVPTEAVLDGKRVFVYESTEGIIRKRNIESGISNWDFTEILSGLKVGDSVVVNVDQEGLEDGVKAVRVEKDL